MKMQMLADFKLYKKDKDTGYFRPMTEEDFDDVCPGGFIFEVDGKAIPFDWDAQSTNEQDGVFHYESGYGPFFNDFEIPEGNWDEEYEELGLKREDISPKLLASVTNIQDFYVNFTLKGEDVDEGIGDNLHPESEYIIELKAITLEERDTGNTFDVDEKVLEKFNGNIISYNDLLNEAYELYKKEWCGTRGFNYEAVAKAEARGEEYEGVMYVCRNEFEDCEFKDIDYMVARFPDYFELKIIDDRN